MVVGLSARANTNKDIMNKYYLGIDIGGTNIKAVILNDYGEILEKKELLTEDFSSTKEIWKSNIKKLITEKTIQFSDGKEENLKIGISAPGLVDQQNKYVLCMPERLNGIENYNWSIEFNREIVVLNDGHAACLAEFESFYKQAGLSNIIMLTLGTGVGGGAILNGELFQGNLQRAGHFGHMTIDSEGPATMTNMVGSLEYALGNFSIIERTHGKFKSVKDLFESYKMGNSLATFWWLSSIQKLATALASLINILSPNLIILGGGIAAGAQNELVNPLKEFMTLYEWKPVGKPTEIALAKHGNFSGAIGAAYFAKLKNK